MQKIAKITRGKLNPTTEQIAYLAGVIDSDGCIAITKAIKTSLMAKTNRIVNPRYVLRITVTNTSMDLMNWLYENFDGSRRPKPRAKLIHKITYDWIYDNGKAIYILKLVRPYLVVKQRQADLGIEFIEKWEYPKGGQGSKVPDHEVQRRERCWLAMRFLNQLGDTAATTESESPCDGHRVKRQSELMGNHEREIRSGFPATISGQ
jgi:hypothetical protein